MCWQTLQIRIVFMSFTASDSEFLVEIVVDIIEQAVSYVTLAVVVVKLLLVGVFCGSAT